MKKFNKVIALVLAVLFVAASFAACSSNSGKDDKGTTEAAKTQKVKVIDIALSDEEYAFGVDKKQPELKEQKASGQRQGKNATPEGTFSLGPGSFQQEDQADGTGEGDHDGLVQTAFRPITGHRARQADAQHGEEVFHLVSGIGTTLRDQVGENGVGQPADDAQESQLWKEDVPDVVYGHGHHTDEF